MKQSQQLSGLLAEIGACRICEAHLELGPRPVVQGSARAKILIAGQAPGTKVHRTGIPFDDPSGDLLRKWLGVDKNTFYNPEFIAIAPMGFCYPGKGKSGDLPPRTECAQTWRDRLLAEFSSVELTLLVGQYSQQWHLRDTMKTNLTETVGAWHTYLPKYLPMPHPSPRNRFWMQKNPWFAADVVPWLQLRVEELLPESSRGVL